jgi:protein-S-isoprenylcysteine O-methyltransferase Ste14
MGFLYAGTLAQMAGEPLTVITGAGVLLVLAVVAWFFLPGIRREE